MYKLVPVKRSSRVMTHDYEFKDFKSFYELAKNINVPLFGRYSIAILSDKIEDITEFLKVEKNYSCLMIYIYTSEALIDYMLMRDMSLSVENKASEFETFKNLIAEKNLLFDKDVISVLYASIEHNYDAMNAALNLIVIEYGKQQLIKEKMLAELFILNKTIYPRQVLMAYLRMDRYRQYKLNKCLEMMGNDVVLGAFVKNIKKLVEEKSVYFKTGKCKQYVKDLSTTNVTAMYRIMLVERNGLNDLCLLLELYERGLSSYDIVQGESN